jgi:hypothetical protein
LLVASGLAALPATAASDADGDGYVGRFDGTAFVECLGGPDVPPPQPDCTDAFDADDDGDVDAADFALLSRDLGHLPIPLKDNLGDPVTPDSTRGYSGRETCGSTDCHDITRIANGLVFEQGRTDPAGNIIMQDDFFGDGRWWVRSAGMYGRWSGGSGGLNRQTAGKDNAHESVMDLTAFNFSYDCGRCHSGGGGMEFDRDGVRLWDEATGLFGYEAQGQGPGDVLLDGDYAHLDEATGTLSPAPWDVTGVADPGCLSCHRARRTWIDDQDMHREWRAAVLETTTELVDSQGAPVPAFAVANTAGQGWFSTLDTESTPPVLQIDYSVGVNPGELVVNETGGLSLDVGFVARPPTDRTCWGCHLAGGFQNKRGTVWFDERDTHYNKFTRRSDDDPNNDLTDDQAAVCNTCHPNDLDHDFAKGDSPYSQFRNELDWFEFRSCRECHLTWLEPGVPNPDKHPDAPDVPGSAVVHNTGGMMAALSCQACHVPYALEKGIIVTDRSLTGTAVSYFTDEFLSADPLDPWAADKSTWYPTLATKVDSDGNQRLFPQKNEVAIYWADWDQNETPEDLSDDTIHPTILWRVRQITGNAPLPGVTDDDGDGKLEVNRVEEILLYIQALKGNDSYGRPVASNPVLVKGGRVWYEDPEAPGGVASFEHEGTGIVVQSYEVFGLDHNVLAQETSWGAWVYNPAEGCPDCHVPTTFDSPVFDRLILVDPFDENGDRVYKTVRELSGVNPP